MADARLWISGDGRRRWQPITAHRGGLIDHGCTGYAPARPLLYRSRRMAIFAARRAERDHAAATWKPADGEGG